MHSRLWASLLDFISNLGLILLSLGPLECLHPFSLVLQQEGGVCSIITLSHSSVTLTCSSMLLRAKRPLQDLPTMPSKHSADSDWPTIKLCKPQWPQRTVMIDPRLEQTGAPC